ncbi:hypothetical protein [Sediminibacterium ginsengisoli]|uniref:Uncharacterized protein n=1 Tax=Sediminibacterium ginsengisoli TaxID=413434 RepID=A0A1T4NY28_9BACT|nr:hypothetical protein [Sediminibacterium ginsengisoli]SJZ84280.1 hypothetical protein SAMN04488132_10556 [Sediminibacterium ginsengisoli]
MQSLELPAVPVFRSDEPSLQRDKPVLRKREEAYSPGEELSTDDVHLNLRTESGGAFVQKIQSGNGVVQRQVICKFYWSGDPAAPDVVITDLVIGGRSDSPFTGTMGAHSTAWVVHTDAVRRQVNNRRPIDAARQLCVIINADLGSNLRSISGQLKADHKDKLDNSITDLTATVAACPADATGGNRSVVHWLRKAIREYLTYVNYLPLSTVFDGKKEGQGEGSARGNIAKMEYLFSREAERWAHLEDEIAELKNTDILADYKELMASRGKSGYTAKAAAFKPLLSAEIWKLFAADTPDKFGKPGDSKNWKLALEHFTTSASRAYPFCFSFAGLDKAANQKTGLKAAMTKKELTPKFGSSDIYHPIADLKPEGGKVGASDFEKKESTFISSIILSDSRDADVTISEVHLEGRTTSPLPGTMGAHSIAWIAHVDAIRNLLITKKPDAAFTALQAKATKLLNTDPSLVYVSGLPTKQQRAFLDARIELEGLAGFGALRSMDAKADFLEKFTGALMNYINTMPLSTVEKGGVPGGRREGDARKVLLAYERNQHSLDTAAEGKETVLRNTIKQLFDPNTVDEFNDSVADKFEKKDFEGYDAKSLRIIKAKKVKKDVDVLRALISQRFLDVLLEAYPISTADAHLDVKELQTLLAFEKGDTAGDEDFDEADEGGGDSRDGGGAGIAKTRPRRETKAVKYVESEGSSGSEKEDEEDEDSDGGDEDVAAVSVSEDSDKSSSDDDDDDDSDGGGRRKGKGKVRASKTASAAATSGKSAAPAKRAGGGAAPKAALIGGGKKAAAAAASAASATAAKKAPGAGVKMVAADEKRLSPAAARKKAAEAEADRRKLEEAIAAREAADMAARILKQQQAYHAIQQAAERKKLADASKAAAARNAVGATVGGGRAPSGVATKPAAPLSTPAYRDEVKKKNGGTPAAVVDWRAPMLNATGPGFAPVGMGGAVVRTDGRGAVGPAHGNGAFTGAARGAKSKEKEVDEVPSRFRQRGSKAVDIDGDDVPVTAYNKGVRRPPPRGDASPPRSAAGGGGGMPPRYTPTAAPVHYASRAVGASAYVPGQAPLSATQAGSVRLPGNLLLGTQALPASILTGQATVEGGGGGLLVELAEAEAEAKAKAVAKIAADGKGAARGKRKVEDYEAGNVAAAADMLAASKGSAAAKGSDEGKAEASPAVLGEATAATGAGSVQDEGHKSKKVKKITDDEAVVTGADDAAEDDVADDSEPALFTAATDTAATAVSAESAASYE